MYTYGHLGGGYKKRTRCMPDTCAHLLFCAIDLLFSDVLNAVKYT